MVAPSVTAEASLAVDPSGVDGVECLSMTARGRSLLLM